MPDRTPAALLAHTPVRALHGVLPAAPLPLLDQDSRAMIAGAAFVAVPGFHVDGHTFLRDAAARGAGLAVVQADRRALWQPLAEAGFPCVEVENTRAALADLSAAFHDFPARHLFMVGVTGTDGKSTTTYLTTAMLEAAGHLTGLIGGVEFKVGADWRLNTLTQSSPEAPLVQALLAANRDAGATHAVIEATSHGLALHRLDHCHFDVAVFTGLSDDHLDFHGTHEAYLAAKTRLFHMLDKAADKGVPKRGVVNMDDPSAGAFMAATRFPVLRVGLDHPEAEVTALDVQERADGSRFRLRTPLGEAEVDLPLPARFNVRNALAAAGAVTALGVRPDVIAAACAAFPGVPGRMERIDCGQPFTVYVDAAATTDAFRVVLASLRPLVRGRLIVVFGCAGERDPGRRAGMGRVAAAYADDAVITSENPRSEDPAAIVRTIAAAMRAAGHQRVEEEPDRRAAIARAFARAMAGDVVLIAGKGAEQTLIVGASVQPWDDRTVARELLRGVLRGAGG